MYEDGRPDSVALVCFFSGCPGDLALRENVMNLVVRDLQFLALLNHGKCPLFFPYPWDCRYGASWVHRHDRE